MNRESDFDQESRLEELQESLYDPNKKPEPEKRRLIHGRTYGVPEAWQGDVQESGDVVRDDSAPEKKSRFPMVLLVFSFLACVGAFIFAWFQLSPNREAVFREENTAVSFTLPSFVDAGEEFVVPVVIANRNPESLILGSLELSYVQGTDEDDNTRIRATTSIPEIPSGQTETFSFPVTLYGVPESVKDVRVRYSYTTPSSSARYEKEITQSITLKNTPLVVTVSSIDSVTSNQEMEVRVRVEAVKGKTIPAVALRANYPTGFQFIDASVRPTQGTNTWALGDLRAGDVREILIRGRVRGEDKDIRALTFTLGALFPDTTAFAFQYAQVKKEYTITKPFLDTRITVNGRASRTVNASAGEVLTIQIDWKNNLSVPVQNAEISLRLEGAFVEQTVRSTTGFYDSRIDTMFWTKDKDSKLANIPPGADGVVLMTVRAPDLASLTAQETITLTANVKARRTGEQNVSELVSVSDIVDVRIATRVFVQNVTRRSYDFALIGNVPPRAEQETSYVLETTVQNSVNPIDRGQVTYRLPLGVRYIEGRASKGEVRFSDSDRIVTWNLGSVVDEGKREVLRVHVGLTPSITDIGTRLSLANSIVFTAIDTFTRNPIRIEQNNNFTTQFSEQDGFRRGADLVAR